MGDGYTTFWGFNPNNLPHGLGDVGYCSHSKRKKNFSKHYWASHSGLQYNETKQHLLAVVVYNGFLEKVEA